MNILFVLTKESVKDPYEYAFTLSLIEYLSLKNNTGILTGSTVVRGVGSKLNVPGLSEAMAAIDRIDFTEWDVVVISEPRFLDVFANNSQLNQGDRKAVYICHTKDYRGLPPATQSLLLAFNIMVEGTRDWLPKHKKCNLLRPLLYGESPVDNRPIGTSLNKFKAVHFVLDTDRHLSVAKSIILAMNCLLNVELTIVAPAHAITILTTIVNHNITFVDGSAWDDKLIPTFNLALTSEYQAVKTLYFRVPTLVIGMRGLGKMVTTNNVFEHIQHNFEGRIGAEPGEYIPTLGIVELVVRCLEAPQEFSIEAAEVAKVIANEFAAQKTFGAIESEIKAALEMNRLILSEENYALKPFKMPLSRVVTDQGSAAYLADVNNRIIRDVDQKEAFLFAQCNGERTLRDIIEEAQADDPVQVRSFFLELWNRDILFFRQ